MISGSSCLFYGPNSNLSLTMFLFDCSYRPTPVFIALSLCRPGRSITQGVCTTFYRGNDPEPNRSWSSVRLTTSYLLRSVLSARLDRLYRQASKGKNSPQAKSRSQARTIIQRQQDSMTEEPSDEAKSRCRDAILEIFSDIDPEHLTTICEQGLWQQISIVEEIVNQQDNGYPYPRALKPSLKRKRGHDDDPATPENLAKKFDNEERRAESKTREYFTRRSVILVVLHLPKCFPQSSYCQAKATAVCSILVFLSH